MSTLPLYDMKPSPIASWSALDENKTLQKAPALAGEKPCHPRAGRVGWWWPGLIPA